jgi:hypothetical protein
MKYEEIYLLEIVLQCCDAIESTAMMNEGLKDQDLLFFRGVQSFLNHAAAVSRLIWPSGVRTPEGRRRAAERGEALRSTLRLDDSNPLASRKLRDHLEHLDERLDDWCATSPTHNMLDLFVGSSSQAVLLLPVPRDRFRHFDHELGLLTFRGETFDLWKLFLAIREVLARTLWRLRQLHRSGINLFFRKSSSRHDAYGIRPQMRFSPTSP